MNGMSVHHSSEKMDWATPIDFFERLDSEFEFELDVCAGESNKKCCHYIGLPDNGLVIDWMYFGVPAICWMNPPYGREIGKWMKKAYEESQKGCTVVFLVPSRTDTKWWHDWAMKADEIRLIKGRLTFEGAPSPAPFPSAVVIFRPTSYHTRFVTMEAK